MAYAKFHKDKVIKACENVLSTIQDLRTKKLNQKIFEFKEKSENVHWFKKIFGIKPKYFTNDEVIEIFKNTQVDCGFWKTSQYHDYYSSWCFNQEQDVKKLITLCKTTSHTYIVLTEQQINELEINLER